MPIKTIQIGTDGQRKVIEPVMVVTLDSSGEPVASVSSNASLLTNASDKAVAYTYLDAGTVNERISTVVTSSVSLGLTSTVTFTYAGSPGSYRIASVTHS